MRDRILTEIKRLADGDKPPGKEAFERQTGIKTSEWLGKHWAKWSDAVADAGLVPNEFQQKQDTASLFPKLAAAVRHYGRMPTKPELQMYKRNNPGFPWHSVFNDHFGSKDNMYRSLKVWADANAPDVAAMLPDIQQPERAGPVTEGHVYLIKSGAFYKIGRGDDLERRVKQISVALPDKSTLEHSIRTDDPPGIEAYWHRRFDAKRMNGEWFRLLTSDIAAFKRRKYQ